MTGEQMNLFLNAAEAADIKYYSFDVDDGTHIINDSTNHIVKTVGDMLVGISSSNISGSHNLFGNNKIMVTTADCNDCHKARISGDYDQIKTFLQSLGVSDLSEDDLKIMIDINNKNYELKPITGDYVSGFHYLSKKEEDALSPEEKEEYEAAKAAYEKSKAEYIPLNQAASITL